MYPVTFPLFASSGVSHYLFYYHYGKVFKGMADGIKMLRDRFIGKFTIVIGPVTVHS